MVVPSALPSLTPKLGNEGDVHKAEGECEERASEERAGEEREGYSSLNNYVHKDELPPLQDDLSSILPNDLPGIGGCRRPRCFARGFGGWITLIILGLLAVPTAAGINEPAVAAAVDGSEGLTTAGQGSLQGPLPPQVKQPSLVSTDMATPGLDPPFATHYPLHEALGHFRRSASPIAIEPLQGPSPPPPLPPTIQQLSNTGGHHANSLPVVRSSETTAFNSSLGGLRPARRLAVQPGLGTLQAALDSASGGDTLILTDGTYTGSTDPDYAFKIDKSITIRAQSTGDAILSGDMLRRVLYISTVDSGSVDLVGLRITDGLYNLSWEAGGGALIYGQAGGGVLIYGKSTEVNLQGCNISSNVASYWNPNGHIKPGGGGVHIENSKVNFSNCLITSNIAAGTPRTGGGVFILKGQVGFINCQISSNTAAHGGGVVIHKGNQHNVQFIGCEIASNEADRHGGFYIQGNSLTSSVICEGCNISSNEADSYGGGVYIEFAAIVAFRNCLIMSNWGDSAVYIRGRYSTASGQKESDCHVEFSHCQIVSNTAGGNGGGVCLFGKGSSSLIFDGCTISSNKAVNVRWK